MSGDASGLLNLCAVTSIFWKIFWEKYVNSSHTQNKMYKIIKCVIHWGTTMLHGTLNNFKHHCSRIVSTDKHKLCILYCQTIVLKFS